MAEVIQLSITPDEAAIIVDALEADRESYLEAAKEARGNANRDEVQAFTEAAERVGAVLVKISQALE